MATDLRRNPPPGWRVEKHGYGSMKGWAASPDGEHWTTRCPTRREAVADAWRKAEMGLYPRLVEALHTAGWNPDDDHLIGQPRMGVIDVNKARVIVSKDHRRWVVQDEDGSFVYDGPAVDDAAKAVVAAF